MINKIDEFNKRIKKVKKLFKNADIKDMPTHHGVEWAKLIINEHQQMKDNEANWAELKEFYLALEILSKNNEPFIFYI